MSNKKIFITSLKYFLSWRLILFAVAFLSIYIIPNWGNWYAYVDRALSITNLPSWLWSWGGFDGVHYLRLAQNGYLFQGSQAFFPAYPILINILAKVLPFGTNLDTNLFVNTNYFYAALIISNLAAFFAIFFAFKLFNLEFEVKITKKIIIFLLAFPTAFYMGAIYTESLFILFAVLTLYFYKKEKYLLAFLFSFLVSATRIVGVFIPLILVIDAIVGFLKRTDTKRNIKTLAAGVGGGMGLLSYMTYLQLKFSDALMFLHVQSGFGAERSSGALVSLPRVFYRYFKIFISLGPLHMRFYNAFFELVFTCLALYVLIISFRKINLGVWISSLLILILPTLTGTLSSMPRYVLSAFLLIPFVIIRLKKGYIPVIFIMIILEITTVILFTRGYWVA